MPKRVFGSFLGWLCFTGSFVSDVVDRTNTAPDLVGLGVSGLVLAGIARFSGTLAFFYTPERAAIFTSLLLAAPVTLFLDDLVTRLYDVKSLSDDLAVRVTLGAGIAYVAVLAVLSTGLGALFFGGEAPGSLSARDVNVQQFTISTPELATALWLRKNVRYPNIVQSDRYGQLVLLSEPGSYSFINEIVPPEVDADAYIYLSTANLADHTSQAYADNYNYFTVYRSNIHFFNQNFYVVYSTGATRVYH